jgi:hypothetical protein
MCPICEKEAHPDRTTTDKKENKGCLKSKPANLGCTALPKMPHLPNYTTAAHHLIPAIQCLSKFPRLSQMCEVVGYNVNNAENGLSLPTCAQKNLNRYENSEGQQVKYGKLSNEDKQNVAFLIMEGTNFQWHVGHHNWTVPVDYDTDDEPHPENYDKLVKVKLRDLEKEFAENGDEICKEEEGKESGKNVIQEMNALSLEIKGFVLTWDEFFVSRLSNEFAVKYR